MVIDSHQHIMLPTELQIEKMEEAGVDKVVLFCTTPHPEKANNLEQLKNEMGKLYKILGGDKAKSERERLKGNIENLVKVLEKYPDKFYGFGSVPPELSEEEAVEWIEKYILGNSLKGIGEFTPGNDQQVRDLERIFNALDKFSNLPIWIHTFTPVTPTGIKILMDITRRHPKVPVIFGHMGGYNWVDVIEFAKSTPNVYIDFSAAFSTLAVKMAITEVPDKCLYASDAPYGEALLSKQIIEYMSPSKEVADKILGENIMKLIEG